MSKRKYQMGDYVLWEQKDGTHVLGIVMEVKTSILTIALDFCADYTGGPESKARKAGTGKRTKLQDVGIWEVQPCDSKGRV